MPPRDIYTCRYMMVLAPATYRYCTGTGKDVRMRAIAHPYQNIRQILKARLLHNQEGGRQMHAQGRRWFGKGLAEGFP